MEMQKKGHLYKVQKSRDPSVADSKNNTQDSPETTNPQGHLPSDKGGTCHTGRGHLHRTLEEKCIWSPA
jgi:hypothetical protein